MNLGAALTNLGTRLVGTLQLEAAEADYRAALDEMTRTRAPLGWAQAQLNLGVVLAKLGEREGGTAGLEAAVGAYRMALEEITRDRASMTWAQA